MVLVITEKRAVTSEIGSDVVSNETESLYEDSPLIAQVINLLWYDEGGH